VTGPMLSPRAHLARTIAKELPPEQLELLAGALRVLAREKREQRERDFEVLTRAARTPYTPTDRTA
jgi:hypothetical protein